MASFETWLFKDLGLEKPPPRRKKAQTQMSEWEIYLQELKYTRNTPCAARLLGCDNAMVHLCHVIPNKELVRSGLSLQVIRTLEAELTIPLCSTCIYYFMWKFLWFKCKTSWINAAKVNARLAYMTIHVMIEENKIQDHHLEVLVKAAQERIESLAQDVTRITIRRGQVPPAHPPNLSLTLILFDREDPDTYTICYHSVGE